MKYLAVVLSSVMLVACGGGGDERSTASFNADQALTNLLTKPTAFNGLTATSGSNTFSIDVSFTPSDNAQMNGVSYRRSVQNTVVRVNGVIPPRETFPVQYLFDANPARIRAQIVPSRNQGFAPIIYTISLFGNPASLPVSAGVGSGGVIDTAIIYGPKLGATSTAGATPSGNVSVAWSLEADTASTAYLCLSLPHEKDCLKINPAGDILGMRATITVNGQTLVFQ